MNNKPKRKQGELSKLPLEIRNLMNDILGIAGALYFVTYEEYLSKVNELCPPLGITTDRYLDIKKDLTNPIDRLHKTATRFSIRVSDEKAFERNQDDQYNLYLAFKALCRMPSDQMSDEAIRLSRNEPNFTTRNHFVDFLTTVVDKARTSNLDAIEMIKKLLKVLEDDKNERVIYDHDLKDFRLSNIELNDYKNEKNS